AAAKLADDGVEHATVEIVQAQLVYLQQIEGLQGDLAVDSPFGAHLGKVADTAQEAQRDSRRAARATGNLGGPFVVNRHFEDRRAPMDDRLDRLFAVEFHAVVGTRTGAQGGSQQRKAGRRADDGEVGELEPHVFGAGPLADDEVEDKILHRRVENLLYGATQAVDFVDEEDVPGTQVGEDRRQVAGTLDDRPGSDADIHVHLIGDDVGERGLTQARRPVKEDVVQRLAARLGRLDEDAQIRLQQLLSGEVGQMLGAQQAVNPPVIP